ncbi:MAG: hypothetical protein QNJ55_22435 [Xenococcus sp. MO_188.B8]|nr:hypothetical protein [Xenococcus sp. MO_188.B8]
MSAHRKAAGLFLVEIIGSNVPRAYPSTLVRRVAQGQLVGIAGANLLSDDPANPTRIVFGTTRVTPVPFFSTQALLVFSVPPVSAGSYDIRVVGDHSPIELESVEVCEGYPVPDNATEIVDEFFNKSEAIFLGLHGLFAADTIREEDEDEREFLEVYLHAFDEARKMFFHELRSHAINATQAEINDLARRIIGTDVLIELEWFLRELEKAGLLEDEKGKKGKWIEEDIKALLDKIPDKIWGWDFSYLKKVLNKIVSIFIGRKKKGK